MSFSAAIPVPGRAWRKLTLTELKLLLRTPAALFWGIGFPVAGLIVLGLIPGTGKPVKAFGGASVLQTYLPIIITFMIVMTGVQFLPATLVTYRERGILRRMFTTPVTPRALLTAQLALILGVQIATTALIVILATGAFTASIGQPLAFIVAFLLMAAAASTLGLLVAAVSFTSKAANARRRRAVLRAAVLLRAVAAAGGDARAAAGGQRRHSRWAPACRPSRTPSPGTGPPGSTSACWRPGSSCAGCWPCGCSGGSDCPAGNGRMDAGPGRREAGMFMGTPSTPIGVSGAGTDAHERRLEAWLRVVPFVLLAMSMLPYLITQRPTAGDVGRTLAVVALAAAWVTWWVVLHPDWATRRVLMSVYYAGFWCSARCWWPAARGSRSSAGSATCTRYRFLAGPARYVGLFCAAALSAVAQLGGFHPPTTEGLAIFAVVACLNAMLVGVFIYLGAKSEETQRARKRMIVELAEANRQLETMMAENTGLHAQLLTQAREAGVLEERQRMAREIHDTLAQGLAGIITQLEAAQQAGLRGRPAAAPRDGHGTATSQPG